MRRNQRFSNSRRKEKTDQLEVCRGCADVIFRSQIPYVFDGENMSKQKPMCLGDDQINATECRAFGPLS